MPRPLDALLRDHVAPRLKARGFRRSSGTFRLVTGAGGLALVTFRSYPLGRKEIEVNIDLGFTTGEWLASPANRSGVPAERADITASYPFWHLRLPDPSVSVLEHDGTWQLDLDDEDAVRRLLAALDEGVDELLDRMRRWPEVPPPIDREARRLGHLRLPDGRSDTDYSVFGQVEHLEGVLSGGGTFALTVRCVGPTAVVQLGEEAVSVLTGGRPFADLAEAVGLGPVSVFAQAWPSADRIWAQGTDTRPYVVIDLGDRGRAFLPLGDLTDELRAEVRDSQRLRLQIVLADEDALYRLTLLSSLDLAERGLAWAGVLGATPESA